jgi:hypothetical protein
MEVTGLYKRSYFRLAENVFKEKGFTFFTGSISFRIVRLPITFGFVQAGQTW